MSVLCLFLFAGHAFAEVKAAEERAAYAKQWLEKGLQHYEKGEYDASIEDFTKAIDLTPDFAKAYINRGHALEKRGLKERARADYDKVAGMERSKKVNEWFSQGMQYFQKKEYDKALAAYSRAIELQPDLVQAYANRGAVYNRLGKYDRAIADFDKAVALDKDNSSVYENRGLAYFNAGQYEKAIKDYTSAITLKPNDGAAYYNRGVAYTTIKRYDKAIYDLSRALAFDPNNADAYSSRGTAYYKAGDAGNALIDFEKACSRGIAAACTNAKKLAELKSR
jgi:tetratricopeptide (TPR) repeat protein